MDNFIDDIQQEENSERELQANSGNITRSLRAARPFIPPMWHHNENKNKRLYLSQI